MNNIRFHCVTGEAKNFKQNSKSAFAHHTITVTNVYQYYDCWFPFCEELVLYGQRVA
jgi:hypothetical protein